MISKTTRMLFKRFHKLIFWWIGVLGFIYKSPVVYYVTTVQKRLMDKHKLTTNAAAISFFFLLSIIPILFIVLALIASFVPSPDDAEKFVTQFVSRAPESARQFVLDLIKQSNLTTNVASILDNAGWISLISIGSLLWTSSGAFAAIEDALSTIFGVRARNYFVSRLVEMGMVILIGTMYIMSSLIGLIISWMQANEVTFLNIDFSHLPYVWDVITEVMPYLLVVLTFYVMYKIFPRTEIHNRAAFLGAIVASVLLELTLYGFSYYVSHFARYNAFYGSVAGIVIAIFMIYLASIILLIGAEITEIANTKIENTRELRLTIKEFE